MNRFISVVILLLLISFSLYGGDKKERKHKHQPLELVILHNNDAESQLINAGTGLEDFGGAARFISLVDLLRKEAKKSGKVSIMLSSGDNFLAGPEFNASLVLPLNKPFYDSRIADYIGYDAMAIGNHEFDFGPDIFARFISGIHRTKTPFLSANLSFEDEPKLHELVKKDRIKKSTVIRKKGQEIGIIGATTPDLPFISSPRNTKIDNDLAGVIQKEINTFIAKGINKIILISHLQSIMEDIELASQLTGIDVLIAGGGDELLANPDDLLVPGDNTVYGAYPLVVTDAEGNNVYVVTTPGDFKYVGRLGVTFDKMGKITEIHPYSGPVRVAGGENNDAVLANRHAVRTVIEPVMDYVETLSSQVIGLSEVELEGRRPQIRIEETNEGNLVADALLWQASNLAEQYNMPLPDVSIQNGGGIRNNSLIPVGNISELTTFDILPFANFVSIIPAIPAGQFKEIMENAVSDIESVGGRFAQIAGFTMIYDLSGTPQLSDIDGNIIQAGNRIIDITLADGTQIVNNGDLVFNAPDVTVATIDFLARGGDQYPFRGAEFTTVGISYQQALSNYIQENLTGLISAEQYPAGGEGRITQIITPLSKSGIHSDYSNTLPQKFYLHQNYPNPFNPLTIIEYELAAKSSTRLAIYDITGRQVFEVLHSEQDAGLYSLHFDGSQLPSGLYFYVLTAGNYTQTNKMMLIK
jgi:5'-nucleotidase